MIERGRDNELAGGLESRDLGIWFGSGGAASRSDDMMAAMSSPVEREFRVQSTKGSTAGVPQYGEFYESGAWTGADPVSGSVRIGG